MARGECYVCGCATNHKRYAGELVCPSCEDTEEWLTFIDDADSRLALEADNAALRDRVALLEAVVEAAKSFSACFGDRPVFYHDGDAAKLTALRTALLSLGGGNG